MMPAKMMRSAPPDFGDHGRTHRAHDTISSLGRPPFGPAAHGGGAASALPSLVQSLASTVRRACPHNLTMHIQTNC